MDELLMVFLIGNWLVNSDDLDEDFLPILTRCFTCTCQWLHSAEEVAEALTMS